LRTESGVIAYIIKRTESLFIV